MEIIVSYKCCINVEAMGGVLNKAGINAAPVEHDAYHPTWGLKKDEGEPSYSLANTLWLSFLSTFFAHAFLRHD